MCCAKKNVLEAMTQALRYRNEGKCVKALLHYGSALTHLGSILISKDGTMGSSEDEIEKCLQVCMNRITEIVSILENEVDGHNENENENKIDEEHSKSASQVLRKRKDDANKIQYENVSDGEKELMDRIMSTVMCRKSEIKFSDVCGMDEEKELLESGVIMPMMFPGLFNEKRKPFKAFLLFGPPGTGKSYIAQAVAGEASECTYFSLSAADLVSKYFGDSEQLVKTLFKVARMMKPSIIFIDEIDSLMQTRSTDDSESSRRIKTELLSQMEGVSSENSGVFFMAATNTPHQLDSAFIRRFDKLMYVPLPDENAKFKMLLANLMNSDGSTNFTTDEIAKLSKVTEGLSGSDIGVLCRKIQMKPVSRMQKCTHFLKTFDEVNQTWVYTPSLEGNENAIVMKWRDVPRGCLDFKNYCVWECVWKMIVVSRNGEIYGLVVVLYLLKLLVE